ncbi:RseA family anti-sigma factor [Vibrio methylphosphonaticus]|uniref:RseA family anti-sigma factor n=1 Tax=Vibrio methylphosphonaticus TaxID=2946866 RepID=UPI002029BD62|nr:RseA family anti-sigma factor [Vibrio methylphosphonaticus]MCL9773465.1 RseA family anti-sigma factor [Vibrio methylphosphonaticus]
MADKQKLSAFMDGDQVDEALIEAFENDLESKEAWQNYHLIGDVMRGDEPKSLDWNIAESVATALEAEPTYSQAPSSVNTDQVGVATPIESQPTPAQAKRQLPAWLSQFGQVAVAACVSMAVILGVQQYSGQDATQPEAEQLPVLQTIPFAGSAEPVSLTRDSVAKTSNETANVQEQRRRVNALLQDYELQLRLNSDHQSSLSVETESVIE